MLFNIISGSLHKSQENHKMSIKVSHTEICNIEARGKKRDVGNSKNENRGNYGKL